MLILITYDVSTQDAQGRRRLRRVAQCCKDYGQRVQKSVFECVVGEKELTLLRARLLAEMDEEEDSIRIYFLDESDRKRTEHYGRGETVDMEGPLIV